MADAASKGESTTLVRITYDAGLCGLGRKTSNTLGSLRNRTTPTIWVTPTLVTINEAARTMSSLGIKYKHFDSETVKTGKVVDAVEKALYSLENGVLLVTHATFHNLTKSLHSRGVGKRFDVIIDEAPESLIEYINEPVSAESFRTISDNCEFEATKWDDVVRVNPKREQVLGLYGWSDRKFNDTAITKSYMGKLAKLVMNPANKVYALKSTIDNLIDLTDRYFNNDSSAVGKTSKLILLSVPDTTVYNVWKSVHMLSSHFLETEFAHVLRMNGVLDENMTQVHDFDPVYQNSSRLTIKYFTPKGVKDIPKNWSSWLAQAESREHGLSNKKSVIKGLSKIGGSMLWIANVDDRQLGHKYFGEVEYEDGKRYKNKNVFVKQTHGVNGLDNYTQAAFISARNLPNKVSAILTAMDIDRNAVNYARNVLTTYQFVMRSNLRELDEDNQKPVTVYVPDYRAALFLKGIFPKAAVKFIDFNVDITAAEYVSTGNAVGRPRSIPVHWSRADTEAWYRYQKSNKYDEAMTNDNWFNTVRNTR